MVPYYFRHILQNGPKTPKMSKAERQKHNVLCFSRHEKVYHNRPKKKGKCPPAER